jgi:hypothetical protein
MPDKDDFEAVRAVVAALEGFAPDDQERIIRWAREKLALPLAAPSAGGSPVIPQHSSLLGSAVPAQANTPKNLRTFVDEKQPKSDVQFAATVAYYHRFEAPEPERKNEINADDLRNACRLVNRERLSNPLQTLQNAHKLGLLDRPSRGQFSINSVGENLVAMTLPGDGRKGPSKTKAKRASKNSAQPARKRKARK